MERHDVFKDIRGECECEGCDYCPLEILVKMEPRMLEQHKMVEKYKMIISERDGRDIGWEAAYRSWVNSGMAKMFAEVYTPELNHKDLAGMLGMMYDKK